jgi:uncharacterized protein YdaU (DUF1376 family)
MPKDPAFLFYPGDWQGGTMYMNHEQKGCYMDLLILQFHVGKFTFAQAKQVLSICFDVAWPMLQQKFMTDGNLYWNERLSDEIEKRRNFTKSRRENAKGKKTDQEPKAYDKHMVQHMENENENRNSIELKIRESFDEIYLDQEKSKWRAIDFDFEFRTFCDKVRGSPEVYAAHHSLRLAFQSQLRYAKPVNGHKKEVKNTYKIQ